MVYSVIRVAAPLSAARSQLEVQVATQRETIHEMAGGGWTFVTTTPEPRDAAGSQADQIGAELLIFWRAAMVPSQTGRPVGDGRWRTAHPAGTDERGRAAG